MNKKSLKLRQICFFLIAFVPITKFYTMPSILASICANNGLICIAFNFLLDFITLYFIISVIDSEDKNVFTL
ncbi:MAG: hypothetical protein MJ066_06250 [Clostridia bacterium]|nr:hypothetical protein [Clostridia bacterium]